MPTPIRFVAEQLAAHMKQTAQDIAQAGGSESDLSHRFDVLLDDALAQLDVSVGRWSHEKGAARSRTQRIRADAIYGGVVVEFEKPRKFNNPKEVALSIKQVQDGIVALRREADVTAGVATDGFKLAFVRWQNGKPVAEDLQDVTPLAVEELLTLIADVPPKKLTPQNFEFDFGAGSVAAKKTVRALFATLRHGLARVPHVETFYNEWRRILGIIYGLPESDDAPLPDAERAKHQRIVGELAALYELDGVSEHDFGHLLFTVHTYYSLLIKLLIADLMSQLMSASSASLCQRLARAKPDDLRVTLRALEHGEHFAQLRNFLEGDFFRWYVEVLSGEGESPAEPAGSAGASPSLSSAIRYLCGVLSNYRLRAGAQAQTRDLFKHVYQNLVPRRIRHDLGEYYTPDWLAELTLNRLGYEGEGRLLDPSCGSGTFLVLAIERALRAGAELSDVLNNVVGFDISPLAVLAARANYVLAIRDLLPLTTHHSPIEIPVYQTDSILIPQQRPPQRILGDSVPIPTSVGDFEIPAAFADDRALVERVMSLLEEALREKWDAPELLKQCRERRIPVHDGSTEYGLEELLNKLRDLDAKGKDAIWCRVLKNQFAPLFVGRFDFVAGNPPWVNWESLPPSYRQRTQSLWLRFGLFLTHEQIRRRGDEVMSVILGKGKKDLAMLMTYAACESYLNDGGKLGFVVTQSLFKTSGAGQGFRRFRIGNGTYLRVLRADDLVELQPFEGATNRTALLVLQKGERTTYPVPYTLWRKRRAESPSLPSVDDDETRRGRRHRPTEFDQQSTLGQVMQATTQTELSARPVDAKDTASSWLTVGDDALKAVRKVTGKSDYEAHAGVCTWLNSVYWLRVKSARPDGKVVCENVTEGAKTKVPQLRDVVLEPDLLYPLLRGRDVQRWQAQPSAHLLMVQDPVKRRGIDESELKQRCPDTHRYLKRFESLLRQRSGYIRYFKPEDPFYSLFDVGDYTLAEFKVAWTRVGIDLTCAVVGEIEHPALGKRPVVPIETATMVAFDKEDEAHYFCAMLNSSPSRLAIRSSSNLSTGSFGSPLILTRIRIPRYDAHDATHQQLAELSQRAHQLATAGKTAELAKVEAQIDEAAAKVWKLSKAELKALQSALEELA